jgi:hypothetical protein
LDYTDMDADKESLDDKQKSGSQGWIAPVASGKK